MEYWMIILIGLPVLYMTGSLRKSVTNAGVSSAAFVLFFLCAAVLTLLGPVRVAKNISINIAGAFVCLAPMAYLVSKKRLHYSFFVAAVFVLAAGATAVLLRGSYTIAFLPYLVGVVIVAAALMSGRVYAPVYAPALMGVYTIVSCGIETGIRAVGRVVWFDCIGVAMVSICVCLIASYTLVRLWEKREEHRPVSAADR